MARIWLDGGRMKTPEDCYEQFFHATQGLVLDIGGRQNWNLDGLDDDLRDLSEPLTVVVDRSEAASRELGEWFWRFVSTLTEKGDRDQPVEVVLTSAGDLAKNRICLRCGRHVSANADSYETFERMHWSASTLSTNMGMTEIPIRRVVIHVVPREELNDKEEPSATLGATRRFIESTP
jgi:hypothetical protein